MSHLWHFREREQAVLWVIFTNTRAWTSCFLPPGERSDKQSDSGDASGLLDGPRGHAKAGCCFLLCRLERWPRKLHQRGTCAFPAQRSHGIGAFTTHYLLTLTYKWLKSTQSPEWKRESKYEEIVWLFAPLWKAICASWLKSDGQLYCTS